MIIIRIKQINIFENTMTLNDIHAYKRRDYFVNIGKNEPVLIGSFLNMSLKVYLIYFVN